MSISVKKLFSDEPLKRLGKMVKMRIDEAKDSEIEKIKMLRVRKTTNMMMMQPGEREYKGRYRYYAPIYWASVRNDQSAIKAAFNNRPFVSIVPIGTTARENAEKMQKVADWNVVDTRHKIHFHKATDDLAQHGTGILKNRYRIRSTPIPTAQLGPAGEARTELLNVPIGNDYTERVNVMNYYQDTTVTGNDFFVDGCKWVAEVAKVSLLDLIKLLDAQDGVVKKNLRKLIAKVKKDNSNSQQKGMALSGAYNQTTLPGAEIDFSKTTVIYQMYGLYPIKDNEDDERFFKILYSEETNEVIQIQQVPDHPYSLIKAIPRSDSYLGIANSESVGSNQLITNIVNNKSIENLIGNLQRYIFYLKDAFDPRDMQIKGNNNFVPMRIDQLGYRSINEILQQYQGTDINIGSMQAIMAMLNDQRQMATSKSDFFNFGFKSSLGGGISGAGETATGANIVEQNRQLASNDMFNQIAMGQEAHWMKKIFSLQVNLPDFLLLQLNPEAGPEEFRKTQLMGSFEVSIKSGITTNKAFKFNALQGLWQFMAQILPIALQSGKLQDLNYRQIMRSAMELGEMEDIDKILPETPAPQIQAPQGVPGQPGAQPAPPEGGAPPTIQGVA